jgi:hypothetical protein
MENELTTKLVWQKPELTDLDIELTSKINSIFEQSVSGPPAGS